MAKIEALKELILQAYGKEAKMAKAMGWSRQKLNLITVGKREPSVEDVKEISKAIGKSFQETAAFFIDL